MNRNLKIIPGLNGTFNFFQLENNPHPLQAALTTAVAKVRDKDRPAATRELVNRRYNPLSLRLGAPRDTDAAERYLQMGLGCRYANSFIALGYQPQEWKDLAELKQAIVALADYARTMNTVGMDETLQGLYASNCLAARAVYDARAALIQSPSVVTHPEMQKIAIEHLQVVYGWTGCTVGFEMTGLNADDFVYIKGIDHPVFVELETTFSQASDYLDMAETSVRQMKDLRGQISSWASGQQQSGSQEATKGQTQQRHRRLLYQFSHRAGLEHAEFELRNQMINLHGCLHDARAIIEMEPQNNPEWAPPYKRLAMQSNCIAGQMVLNRINSLLRSFSEELAKNLEQLPPAADAFQLATSFAE
ncbi:MAG: hypothetical protein K2W82_15695 [Candidatus Obscuribacterales bacterium]|nr:hypothetical protein [Candidatus Obscuribacterales bacterium]